MHTPVHAQDLSIKSVQPLALPSLFAIFGMIMGSWAGRIPALAEGVHLSHSALSQVLLCGGLGAVISYPLSAWLMATFGARKTLFYAGLALLCVLVGIGLAPTVPRLMMAVLLLGVSASCFDVGINSAATRREQQTGKSGLSRLHGIGCAGGLAGATLGSLMAGMHIPPSTHFIMVAAPLALLLWLAYGLLDAGDAGENIPKKAFCLPRGPLALLGLLGFFGAMSEGSIADWSGIFLKEHFRVTDGFAPLSLSAFSVMMLACRLSGDRLKRLFGARRLVCGGAVISAAGLFFAALAPNAAFALAGFAAAGVGLALLFPFVFSAAGAQGPVALAGVATMTYSGSLMGPPVIGAIAQGAGMQAAMGFVGMLSVAICAVAAKAALLK
jgi:MFS family permease